MDIVGMVTGTTRIAAVIGHPVAHSVSPQLHNTISAELGVDLVYVPIDVPPENLGAAVGGMRALNFAGFNVTVPHKKNIIKYLDESCKEALLVGAVNTVKNIDGRLYGYNTDVEGFAKAFREEMGTGFQDMSMVIFGAGGSARAIAVKTASDGAKKIRICGRDPLKSAEICSLVNDNIRNVSEVLPNDITLINAALDECDIIVNASISGMMVTEEGVRTAIPDDFGFDRLVFKPGQIVYDIVYDPPVTFLMAQAARFGCRTMNGLRMLFWQGIYAYEIWTGIKIRKEFLAELYPAFREAAMTSESKESL